MSKLIFPPMPKPHVEALPKTISKGEVRYVLQPNGLYLPLVQALLVVR